MSDGLCFEDLSVGLTASFGKTITEADIVLFAAVTGDTNPMHLNADYAKTSVFGERIAHGMLAAGLITKVLGTQLPGPGTIYMSQTLKFRAPVRIGETVTATVEVLALHPEKHRATLRTVCAVRGKPVLEGEALVSVPSRAARQAAAAGGGMTPTILTGWHDVPAGLRGASIALGNMDGVHRGHLAVLAAAHAARPGPSSRR